MREMVHNYIGLYNTVDFVIQHYQHIIIYLRPGGYCAVL